MSKNYCAEQRPKARKLTTRIIADDRGHLSEEQDCKPGRNPFGHFHGTWDKPCHHPGNHCDNTISRSPIGIAILNKSKEIYEAKIKEVESKHDIDSENRKRQMAGI
ncbi:unnamed protein product [Rodentolepis nana]|uniref:Cilia- and flagella-associated protein 126 n=1 Tax=Rodentolepis nana TaxID=102285 RepID=A0A0R3T7Z2_RODNA|nr:unnamed protein product [Rodentolepis nana]